jgi:hypothetical protein
MNDNDPLDRLLREDAARRLDDAGFTARVMAALPAPRRARAGWFRPVLILGSTLLGSVLAVALAPAGTSLAQGFVDLARSHALTSSALTGIAICAGLWISAIVLAAEID